MNEKNITNLLKRSLDLCLCIICLCVFFIPILLIMILLLIFQGRPIFFKQLRPGLNEKPFELIKFRTMIEDPNQYKAKNISSADEARLTKIGRMLRASSLDELPSLINVLFGEMSFVGPRPLLMHYLKLYTPEQSKRHNVKPGITGWAQINGRDELIISDKVILEDEYLKRRSFFFDLIILWKTLVKVVKQDSVSH